MSRCLSARLSVSLDVSERLSELASEIVSRSVSMSLCVSGRLSERAERLWASQCISLNVSGALRVYLHVRLGVTLHFWTSL